MSGLSLCRAVLLACTVLLAAQSAPADSSPSAPQVIYDQLRAFRLGAEAHRADGLVFSVDRVELTLNGEIYFAEPVDGRTYGAVFLGQGSLKSEPTSAFEKSSVQRFLKSERVEAAFGQAVLRFSGDEAERLRAASSGATSGQVDRAQQLALALEDRLERETGLNLSSRLLQAIANSDQPGVFYGEFDRGDRGRFSLLIDHQTRSIDGVFGLDGGEKGVFFQYDRGMFNSDFWTAFYDREDFERGRVLYGESFALFQIPDYRMEIDLLEPTRWLRMKVEVDLVALRDGLVVAPFKLNEGLGERDDQRLKKGVKVKQARMADGAAVGLIQGPWEAGFSLILPRPLPRGEKATVVLEMEGRDTLWNWTRHFHYPLSTTTWFPRHIREFSRYDLAFRHRERTSVVSVGQQVSTAPDPANDKQLVTRWVTPHTVQLATFALGPFEKHSEMATVNGAQVPVEYFSAPGGFAEIKESFLLAELINSVHYFSALYGDYAYPRLGAVFSPRPFGQGFPTLLLLPSRGRGGVNNFALIAHEGAHQWWGNMVSWRSYRDQWLSEGFAEYSSLLYTGRRDSKRGANELLQRMRRSLDEPPGTDTGIARGKLNDIGPLIMGHRLNSRLSQGGYSTLIYNKGGLVLRMVHYLLSDPSTGNDAAFFDMMRDFVRRHQGAKATTETFAAVASEHFARSPLGQRYGLQNLDWFFQQWVYGSERPAYRLEYQIAPAEGGGAMLTGIVRQTGVPEGWFMVLPLVMEFGEGTARGAVHAMGPETRVQLKLPGIPKSVKLDPDNWILSERTSETRAR